VSRLEFAADCLPDCKQFVSISSSFHIDMGGVDPFLNLSERGISLRIRSRLHMLFRCLPACNQFVLISSGFHIVMGGGDPFQICSQKRVSRLGFAADCICFSSVCQAVSNSYRFLRVFI
jgi:hypothetical protein